MTFEEKLDDLYKNTVPLIQAGELAVKMADQQSIFILDTRSEKEYEISMIPGAQLIDYDRFSAHMVSNIPKNAQVVVYCSVGYRSERIGEKLIKLGFEDVKNLYGGIFDWKNKGNTVVNPGGNPTDSVHTYNEKWSKWLENGIKVYE